MLQFVTLFVFLLGLPNQCPATPTPPKGHCLKTQCYLILFGIISALNLHFSTFPSHSARQLLSLTRIRNFKIPRSKLCGGQF